MDKALTEKEKQYLRYALSQMSEKQIHETVAFINNRRRSAEKNETAEPKEDPYRALTAMVGCASFKEQINGMIAVHKMNEIARDRGRPVLKHYYHSVFMGNPGCAKTTCARLAAKILSDAGVIKKDSFVELTRASICGKYMGSTAPRVQELFKKYAGGVILIDEAYSLDDGAEGSQRGYGEEAINELIVCLENHPDTVVIFAGYEDKMEAFLQSNPGLTSRIPYVVRFNDYTNDELFRISGQIANENGFRIPDSAREKMYGIFDSAKESDHFGNGRFCRNLVEAAIKKKCVDMGLTATADLSRYFDRDLYPDEALFVLDESCFEYSAAEKKKQAIGFC